MTREPNPPIPNLSATIAQMQAIGRINQRQLAQMQAIGRIGQRQLAQLETIGRIKLDAPIFRVPNLTAPITRAVEAAIPNLNAPIFRIPDLNATITRAVEAAIPNLNAPIFRITAPVVPIAQMQAAGRIDLRPIIEQSQLGAPRMPRRAGRAADPTDSEETQ